MGFFLTCLEELPLERWGKGERLHVGCVTETHLEDGQHIPPGAVSQAEAR